jgi:hypothetical protein
VLSILKTGQGLTFLSSSSPISVLDTIGQAVRSRQIHEDLGISFITDLIAALNESFDCKLTDARKLFVLQLGMHSCIPRAV